MKNETIHGRLLAAMSTFIILMVSLITYGMFYITGYYLYFFLFITSLFLGSTNLLFILLKCEDMRIHKPKKIKVKKAKKRRKKKDIEESQEEIEEDVKQEEKHAKKKQFSLHPVVLPICLIGYVLIFYYCCTRIVSYAKTVINEGKPIAAHAVFLIILFVVITILERLCKHSKDNTRFVSAILSNCRVFFTILSVQTVLAAVCVIVEVLQLVNIQKYIGYIYTGIFFYYVAFVTLSLLIILMRKELAVAPYIHVPVPFVKREIDGQEKSFVEYLEENTGITLRSLWSIKYIRDITPSVVFLIAVLLWLSTCIIQVETNQQAAVYRIGNLQEKILKPGLHLTLPYPFDKVEIYDTENVNKTTIGYKATENADNIWTEGHEGEEYKLLLGGGDEVVSINLRLEYKISDLKQYLTTATSPESMMQALAYELVTDQTIATDLSSLMSADRDAFSENFQKELAKMMEEKNLGLEVVAVILESIHPPVEIAWVYQELISAGINAEKYLVNAQDVAAVTIAQAETTHDTTVGGAQVSYEEKVAAAKASVTEFMASVEAYNASSDAYKYQKYLAAVRKAYGNANLVILGEGVDQSAIYFGNIAGNSGNSVSGNSGNNSNSNSNSNSGNNSTQQ
ncbi:MAG: hypothetical protein IKU39_06260 [Lachnospiraceae bacterium]|nr:hypothetical protein [Lachnospiraceae bacterium]